MGKIMLVVGARPQFIKAAPVVQQEPEGFEWLLVHTGQHYDFRMSKIFFSELSIPTPDRELEVGPMAPAKQVSTMVERLWEVIDADRPAACAVFGDTNSTLAGALAAALASLPLAHVEAGLRSGDMKMPEERNRVIADKLAGFLLVPHARAAETLKREGTSGEIIKVGDPTYETALAALPLARDGKHLEPFGVKPGEYLLVTCHRQGTVDNREELGKIVNALSDLPLKAVFPVHPRTGKQLREFGLWEDLTRADGVVLSEPSGYITTLALIYNAAAVITDSGGVQREAFLYGVPAITVREKTEWPETVEGGGNVLVGSNPASIKTAVEEAVSKPFAGRPIRRELLPEPKPSKRIAKALVRLARQ